MREIQHPPAFRKLLETLFKDPKRFARVMAHTDPAPAGRYRHWDKLRRLKPPDHLSLQDWWLAIKLGRQHILREIPLKASAGGNFRYAMVDPVLEKAHEVDHTAGGRIGHSEPDALTDPRTKDQYLVSSLMEEAITSSQLEGATTTREVAKEMIRSGREPKDTDERMIMNNYQAMLYTREHRNEELTPEFILKLHSIVTEGTMKNPDAAGRLRRSDEPVVVWDEEQQRTIHDPPPAAELPKRMERMCAFANGTDGDKRFMSPVVRAILLHFWLAYDHPFCDGNGRTARALFYWSMLRGEYWLCEYISLSRVLKTARPKYMRSFVYCETDDNDATYFILSQLDFILKAVRDLHEYIGHKALEQRKMLTLLREGQSDLNYRQIALLTHAVKHSAEIYTIQTHQKTHSISYETSRSDLLELERLSLLKRWKLRGKILAFMAPKDLEARLQAKS